MWFISRRQAGVILDVKMKMAAMVATQTRQVSADPDPRRRGGRGSPSSRWLSTAHGCFTAPAPRD